MDRVYHSRRPTWRVALRWCRPCRPQLPDGRHPDLVLQFTGLRPLGLLRHLYTMFLRSLGTSIESSVLRGLHFYLFANVTQSVLVIGLRKLPSSEILNPRAGRNAPGLKKHRILTFVHNQAGGFGGGRRP